MKEKMLKIIDFLEAEYAAMVDCCGEDDETNTIPCKEALNAAKEVAKEMTQF